MTSIHASNVRARALARPTASLLVATGWACRAQPEPSDAEGGGPATTAVEPVRSHAGPGTAESRDVEPRAIEHARWLGRSRTFLAENMPERDRGRLPDEVLATNIEYALRARVEFPWSASVPEDLFLNDVLPYAVFDETREAWRPQLFQMGREITAGCRTATEAAQALNRELFGRIGVHYDTRREKPNQSVSESRASGKASCTGLSIALVLACRAVGVPARAVGTPSWATKPGNHTWVEVWDGDWHYLGADEYDAAGLDRGWFTADAAAARADVPRHRIYATSWRRSSHANANADATWFPMVWNERDRDVPAVDVTARYARVSAAVPSTPVTWVRVLASRGGPRIEAELELLDETGAVIQSDRTRAGTSDMNDMAGFLVERGVTRRLRIRHANATREVELTGASATIVSEDGTAASTSSIRVLEFAWSELAGDSPAIAAVRAWVRGDAATRGAPPATALTREEAEVATKILIEARRAELVAERRAEMDARAITVGEHVLRWNETTFGDAPEGRRSLWISLHGGGNAAPEVNDQQWKNQGGLYQPTEGIYVAPRAPTNTWNLWHEAHVDPLFARLIEDFVALRGVDPDRVYLMGYSAGGDGVWQVAPRMADHFAAAAMMAGHPNEASLLSLRNLPFAILMGADDGAYDRNKIARERATQLDQLQAADPGGYEHFVRIYEGLGHWMKKKDAEVLPWLAQHARSPWPTKIVWFQDDVVHDDFYWLRRGPGEAKAGDRLDAVVDRGTIRVTTHGTKLGTLTLELSDEWIDLDTPVTVEVDGRPVPHAPTPRSALVIWSALQRHFDPHRLPSAHLTLGG